MGLDRLYTHKRIAFKFGLRTLLVFVFAVAAITGWWSCDAKRQRNAVRSVEMHHPVALINLEEAVRIFGAEELGWMNPNEKATIVYSSSKYPWLGRFLEIDYLDEVVAVCMNGSTFGDRDLAALADFEEVEYVFLVEARVTDKGLTTLRGLRRLQLLRLDGTQVTAQGVERLRAELPNCDIVY